MKCKRRTQVRRYLYADEGIDAEGRGLIWRKQNGRHPELSGMIAFRAKSF
jgi:hypothetical protein